MPMCSTNQWLLHNQRCVGTNRNKPSGVGCSKTDQLKQCLTMTWLCPPAVEVQMTMQEHGQDDEQVKPTVPPTQSSDDSLHFNCVLSVPRYFRTWLWDSSFLRKMYAVEPKLLTISD